MRLLSARPLKRFRKRLRSHLGRALGLDPFGGGAPPERLTETQRLFVEWNATRLGIPVEQSLERYLDSWSAIRGGHRKQAYTDFCEASYRVFRPFHDDSPAEIYDAYRFHAPLHFLRMLSKEEPSWPDDHPVLRGVAGRDRVRILDYGCGLAQRSRTLAAALRARGQTVDLALADVATLRKPFLLWLCERTGLPVAFLECSESEPVPKLPDAVDVCIANDVFEHLHDPLPVLDAMLCALAPGAFLLTDLAQHVGGYMHVSPSLGALRERLAERGFREVRARRLYRAPTG